MVLVVVGQSHALSLGLQQVHGVLQQQPLWRCCHAGVVASRIGHHPHTPPSNAPALLPLSRPGCGPILCSAIATHCDALTCLIG